MRKVETRTIGNAIFKIQQLGAKEGRLVLARILRAVGPAIEDADHILSKLAASLADAEVTYLCDTFAKTTMVAMSDTPDREVPLTGVFDDIFAGNYGDMLKWLWECLQVNFGSFLADLGLDANTLTQAMQSGKSLIPTSPTMPFGGSSLKVGGG